MSKESTITVKSLLSQVSILIKKYDEITSLTGEKFNIFSVLKLQSDEVRLHSRLLGELLNPKGTHGQNELFLGLFISSIPELEAQYLNEHIKNATVIVEENIGNISDDYSKGGRIDIIIKFPNQLREIVIENKIYAGDELKQLARYSTQYPKANILYLTLHGKKPSNESLGGFLKEEDITCISYKNEIKNWLEKCLKRSVNFPLLRETISQYIYLIKYLTNQTINEKMKNELIDLIIKDQEYTKAAEEIFKVWEFCKFKIIDNLKPEIKKIADELNLESEIDNEKLGDKDSAFCFFKADSPISIIFYFESKLDNLLVGIGINEKHASDELNLKLKSHFANFTFKDKLNYPNWIWVEKFSAWEETPWEEINAKIPEEIRKTLVILIKKIEEFKP